MVQIAVVQIAVVPQAVFPHSVLAKIKYGDRYKKSLFNEFTLPSLDGHLIRGLIERPFSRILMSSRIDDAHSPMRVLKNWTLTIN